MINRAAVLLRFKEPALRWINETDMEGEDHRFTLAEINEERTVYLISDDDADTQERLNRWVKRNFDALFEAELMGWCTDEKLWPKPRTLKLFKEWFAVECHTVIQDTVEEELYNDEI